jgi:hypothetical protein
MKNRPKCGSIGSQTKYAIIRFAMYGQITSFADLQHPPQCGGRPWHLQRPFLKKSGFDKSEDFSKFQNKVIITCVKT